MPYQQMGPRQPQVTRPTLTPSVKPAAQPYGIYASQGQVTPQYVQQAYLQQQPQQAQLNQMHQQQHQYQLQQIQQQINNFD